MGPSPASVIVPSEYRSQLYGQLHGHKRAKRVAETDTATTNSRASGATGQSRARIHASSLSSLSRLRAVLRFAPWCRCRGRRIFLQSPRSDLVQCTLQRRSFFGNDILEQRAATGYRVGAVNSEYVVVVARQERKAKTQLVLSSISLDR
jgi:hypothetical protein